MTLGKYFQSFTRSSLLDNSTWVRDSFLIKLEFIKYIFFVVTAIRIAHLALKHRLGKNHRMRIVVFVGSPIEVDSNELENLARRLKKEKVNVDIVNFGEEELNTEKLVAFVDTLNGWDGSGSHLVTVPRGGINFINVFLSLTNSFFFRAFIS